MGFVGNMRRPAIVIYLCYRQLFSNLLNSLLFHWKRIECQPVFGGTFGAAVGWCSAVLILGRQCDKAGVTNSGDMRAGKCVIE
jgi:hypothetical protein